MSNNKIKKDVRFIPQKNVVAIGAGAERSSDGNSKLVSRIKERRMPLARSPETKLDKKNKCPDDTLYSVTFNYYSNEMSGKKSIFPVTYRNFNTKLGDLTKKLKEGNVVKYVPENTKDINYGLEAKIIKIKKTPYYYEMGRQQFTETYDIKFMNPLLNSKKTIKNISQYTGKHENIIKINKIKLYFCATPSKDLEKVLINEHAEDMMKFTFLRHKYPTKIHKKKNKWKISFWIPSNSKADEIRQININNYSIKVKIPKILPNTYTTIDIDETLNREFYSRPPKDKIKKEIRPIRFIPSWIFAKKGNYDKKMKKNKLIKPPKNKMFTIDNASIIKHKKNNFVMMKDSKDPKQKSIEIDVHLTFKITTKPSKDETRSQHWKRKFEDWLESDSVCENAKIKLAQATEKLKTIKPMSKKKKNKKKKKKKKKNKEKNKKKKKKKKKIR